MRRKREEIALLEKGGASEDDILAAKAKYHALSDEYVKFSKAMNLPQQRERISVDGFKGVDTSFGKPAEIEDKTVAKSDESGIIKETSKKPITIITDNAIKSVPKVEISGYTAEQCAFIQEQHKELLRCSRDVNNSCEVAFVFKSNSKNPIKYFGTDNSIDFGTGLFGNDIILLHNHPRNTSYSYKDLVQFVGNRSIKTMTIVKNNGNVETLTKLDGFDTNAQLLQLSRLERKMIISKSNAEYEKLVLKFLTKNTGGVIEWNN